MRSRLLTIKRVSEITHYSPSAVRLACKAGALKSERKGVRYRVLRADALAWASVNKSLPGHGPRGRKHARPRRAPKLGAPKALKADNNASGWLVESLRAVVRAEAGRVLHEMPEGRTREVVRDELSAREVRLREIVREELTKVFGSI